MIYIIIVVSLIVAGAIAYFGYKAYEEKLSNKRLEYVKTNSTKIASIKKINGSILFEHINEHERLIDIRFFSKKDFDRFKLNEKLCEIFSQNKSQIRNFIKKARHNESSARIYNKEIGNIPNTNFNELPQARFINENQFLKIEESLSKEIILIPETNITFTIRWSYFSPTGRSHYIDEKTFTALQTDKFYKNFFGASAMDKNKEEKQEEICRKVSLMLKNDAYKLEQVISIFNKLGYETNETIAVSTLFRSGFKLSKNNLYYIKNSVDDIKDIILASADNDGIITYENTLKDDEYDKAIDKLQKDGRIIPLNNLQFLKVSKALNYKGVTLNAISDFGYKIIEFSNGTDYISLREIKEGIVSPICNPNFDDVFLYSIIKFSNVVKEVSSLKNLFTTLEDNKRLTFLKSFFKETKSINAYDLATEIREKYDVEYPVTSMVYDINKNELEDNLYYNNETETIYLNKNVFFDEMEDLM